MMNANKTAEKKTVPQEIKSRKLSLRPQPVLRFTPTAWAKLLFFRDRGATEIGGFGITEPDDLLRIVDFITVKQEASVTNVSFDDEAVANFFEEQVDTGRRPEQFARIWVHTHPGDSPGPSHTDQETFQRVFGHCDWAVMFILAQDGKTSARLRFNVGPRGDIHIPVCIDYSMHFPSADQETWEAEYQANIKVEKGSGIFGGNGLVDLAEEFYGCSYPQDWIEELEMMDPNERRLALEELAARPDLYSDSESEVDL